MSNSSKAKAKEALDMIYNDVMSKINLGCVVQETIQCLLEKTVTLVGEELFDDPDLERVINIQKTALSGRLGLSCNPQDKCDNGKLDIDFDIGSVSYTHLTLTTTPYV